MAAESRLNERVPPTFGAASGGPCASEELVLKGGNATSLVYRFGTRASLDLDLSIETACKEVEDIERRIFKALQGKFGEVGFIVFDSKIPGGADIMLLAVT